jgi:hypothetical protein
MICMRCDIGKPVDLDALIELRKLIELSLTTAQACIDL